MYKVKQSSPEGFQEVKAPIFPGNRHRRLLMSVY